MTLEYKLFEKGSSKFVKIVEDKVQFVSSITEATVFNDKVNEVIARYENELKWLWEKGTLVWYREKFFPEVPVGYEMGNYPISEKEYSLKMYFTYGEVSIKGTAIHCLATEAGLKSASDTWIRSEYSHDLMDAVIEARKEQV